MLFEVLVKFKRKKDKPMTLTLPGSDLLFLRFLLAHEKWLQNGHTLLTGKFGMKKGKDKVRILKYIFDI